MNRREGDSMDDRRVQARVSKLEEEFSAHQEAMRLHFTEHTQLMAMVKTSVEGVKEAGQKMANSMSEIAEVVKIYNHGRGAFEVTKSMGKFILFLSAIIVGISASVAAVRAWLFP